MARQIVKAGGALEIPTVEEILQPLHDRILTHLGKNARFQRDVLTGQADGTGAFSLSNGPGNGLLWAVMMVVVDVGNATGNWGLYINQVQASNAVSATQTGSGVLPYSKGQLILKANDKLIVTNGTNKANANYSVALTIHAIEVPVQHEAQLLL